MLADVLGDVADGVIGYIGGSDEQDITQHQFLLDAAAHGLLSKTANNMTIFLPLEYTGIEEHDDEFEEFFNRHAAHGKFQFLHDGVTQVGTLSQVILAVYPANSGCYAVAGMTLDTLYLQPHTFQECEVHTFKGSSLPSLRPLAEDIASVRTMYLAGESIDMRFEELGMEDDSNTHPYTILAQFTLPDRTSISEVQKTPWQGNGTAARFIVPEVASKTTAMLWICLYDNRHMHSIITMFWPWAMALIPNVDMHPNLEIKHIVPKKARVNDELCILGRNFSPTDLRVSIGASNANVFFSSSSIIRCFVPPQANTDLKQPVWVANGNVYKRYDWFTYIGSPDEAM